MKAILILFFVFLSDLVANAAESCIIDARITQISGNGAYGSNKVDVEIFSTICQIDAEASVKTTYKKEDLGTVPILTLINKLQNDGFKIVSCSRINTLIQGHSDSGSTCYAVK
ncbi:MAG: hypothetical protein JNL11_19380 [Bdellovibrionaceae bacterium]|nr:hypothetical protein [Pseudobdellovibrionaceae bacterium]